MFSEQIVKQNITVLQLGVLSNNVYIVTHGNDCVVIDCPFDNGQLLSYIDDKGYNLCGILLTHGHFDHCGGVATMLARHDVPVYCNSADWHLCSVASSNRWGVPCDSCHPTCDLVDGQITIAGMTFAVTTTPGHTAGGVCIQYLDVLFTGDTLFAGSIGRTDLGGSMSILMSSLAKIAKMNGNYIVCSGHGTMSTLDIERGTNPYMVGL